MKFVTIILAVCLTQILSSHVHLERYATKNCTGGLNSIEFIKSGSCFIDRRFGYPVAVGYRCTNDMTNICRHSRKEVCQGTSECQNTENGECVNGVKSACKAGPPQHIRGGYTKVSFSDETCRNATSMSVFTGNQCYWFETKASEKLHCENGELYVKEFSLGSPRHACTGTISHSYKVPQDVCVSNIRFHAPGIYKCG